jgi:vancomycin resistance protein YoaR
MRVADQRRLDRWVGDVASGIDRVAVDGEIRLTPAGVSLRAPVPGRQLDRQAMVGAILAAHSLGDRQIDLVTRSILPSVDFGGFDDAAAAVRAITTPLEIAVGDRVVREDPAGLSTLIALERTAASPADQTAIPTGSVAPISRFRYDASLDEARVRAWVAAVAAALDRPAKNATYVVAPGGSLTVVPGQDGTKVDQAALLRTVLAELVRPAAGGTRVIAAPVATEVPVFTTADATRYVGSMVPISQFTTYYPPSAARFANISTGANQFDNLVIAPGASFSFWDRLGPVTVERGYKYAGAIINNRSDENVIGGGLCQVSTTLFNAVARAGYQIDERHAHGYYIDRYPVGLDAAVFEPGADFRWTNDTPYPVLITSSGGATDVGFQLWSLPTGRTVTFGPAQVRNFVSVKPDQPADPAFAAGYAVDGRDVVTTRTVMAAGKNLHSDVWASHYVPVWGGPAPKAP